MDVEDYDLDILFHVHETEDDFFANAIATACDQDNFFIPVPGQDGAVVENLVVENAVDPFGNADVGEVLETVEGCGMVTGDRVTFLGVT